MNLLRLHTCFVLIALSCDLSRSFADQAAVGPDPKTVSVLYVGDLDAPRMHATQAFLETYFKKVGRCDYFADMAALAQEYDVVVLDRPRVTAYDLMISLLSAQPDRFQALLPIPASLSKPIVCMGSIGGAVPFHPGLSAMHWRSPYVGDYAHESDLSHPVFQGPLPVDIQWETIDKPLEFFLHPGTAKLGESLRAWRIQTNPDADKHAGFCCRKSDFRRTPDAEAISCGTAESVSSVTIARHGNYFIWGFTSEPKDMTAAGQSIFVNSICYMTAFDGRLPKLCSCEDPRLDFLQQLFELRRSSYKYSQANEKRIEGMNDFEKDNIVRTYTTRSPLLRTDEKKANLAPAYLAKLEQNHYQQLADIAIKTLPREVRELGGALDYDLDSILEYYEQNLEYLRRDTRGRYIADEDAKMLGISNRSPEFLKRCIDLLDSSKERELGLLLLKRYVEKIDQTPEQWKQWYETQGKDLVFDENQSKFVSIGERNNPTTAISP